MKILKKILCIFLSVVVLSLSVGGSYLSADHMEEVNATALATVAAVSLETIIEVVALLCLLLLLGFPVLHALGGRGRGFGNSIFHSKISVWKITGFLFQIIIIVSKKAGKLAAR